MSEKFILSYADYAVLSILLLVSASIGLCFSIFGRKQESNNDYLLAGKNMPIFPISFSLMATFISVATLMGLPTDTYLYGINMAFLNFGFLLGPIITSAIILPIYFKTGVSTPFEYLERRFGKTTKRILSLIFLVQNVLFSGISLYAPALALSAVTNLSMWMSVICIAIIGTLYSTLGGMKAIIWAEVYQAILMKICLIAIIIKGCLDLGGINVIFRSAYDGERILVPTYKLDFSTRYTLWNILLQGIIISASCYCGNHIQVQRQLTLKTLKRSIMSCLLSIPMIITFQLLCCMCGLVIYAYFQTCDPINSKNHPIESYDQLMPYYIINAMREYPGLTGFCITGIFTVSLSTLSSSMNSMAAVTYQDIILPLRKSHTKEVLITKLANFFYGILSVLAAFIVASLGNIMEACILVVGMVGGPILGVFFLASLTTTTNEMGVNIGVLAGFLLSGLMTFIPNERFYPTLPLQTNCSEDLMGMKNISLTKSNIHLEANTSYISQIHVSSTPDDLPISFMWISFFSLLACFVTGYVASWITSCFKGTSNHVSSELLSPLRQFFIPKDRWIENNSNEKNLRTISITQKINP